MNWWQHFFCFQIIYTMNFSAVSTLNEHKLLQSSQVEGSVLIHTSNKDRNWYLIDSEPNHLTNDLTLSCLRPQKNDLDRMTIQLQEDSAYPLFSKFSEAENGIHWLCE